MKMTNVEQPIFSHTGVCDQLLFPASEGPLAPVTCIVRANPAPSPAKALPLSTDLSFRASLLGVLSLPFIPPAYVDFHSKANE